MKTLAKPIILMLLLFMFSFPFCVFAQGAGPQGSLILHSNLDSQSAILDPQVAVTRFSNPADAIVAPTMISFEGGRHGNAVRFNDCGGGDRGTIVFHGDNFDFDDPDGDGGRLDYLMRFDENPDAISGNSWIARSNYAPRYINLEYVNSYFTIINFSDIPGSIRTTDKIYRINANHWPAFDDMPANQWHWFTFTWRRNPGTHTDEMHLYIDGSQAGCQKCSDYNVNMPPVGGISYFSFAPPLVSNQVKNCVKFSLDEVYSFNSWNYDGITGDFPNLIEPERVEITFPIDPQAPWWGKAITESNVIFEFFAINDSRDSFSCDLYIDGTKRNSTNTSSHAHTKIALPTQLANGQYNLQIKCDGNTLVSPVRQFSVNAPSHCTDGTQNQDETGRDCGGSCGPCFDSLAPAAPENLNLS